MGRPVCARAPSIAASWRIYGHQQIHGKSPRGRDPGAKHRRGHGPSGYRQRASGAGPDPSGTGHRAPHPGSDGRADRRSGRSRGGKTAQASLRLRRRHGPQPHLHHPASGQGAGRRRERIPAHEGRIRQRGPSVRRAGRERARHAAGRGLQGIQHQPCQLRPGHGEPARRCAGDQPQPRRHGGGPEQVRP